MMGCELDVQSDFTIKAIGKDFSALTKIDPKSQKFIIYGAGVNGEIFAGFFHRNGIEISYFVDMQATTRDFSVLGKPVRSPAYLANHYCNEMIVVSPDDHISILNLLHNIGISEKRIIIPFKEVEWNIVTDYNMHKRNFVHDANFSYLQGTIFSIVYNTPPNLLKRAIESVLRQTQQCFSYLIIDNGSTDSSQDIITSYATMDRRIKYIRLEKNLTWTDARLIQVLMDNVKGKYVCMLDSDDYYEKSFLETTCQAMEKYNVDIVQVNTLTYSEANHKYHSFNQSLGKGKLLKGDELIISLLLRMLNVTFWGKLYAVDIFQKLLEEILRYASDTGDDRFRLDISWVTYIVLQARSAYLCDEILHVRTWRKGSNEFNVYSIAPWLTSMIQAFRYLEKVSIDETYVDVYKDAALVWLFSLQRKEKKLSVDEKDLLNHSYVQKFLSRPLCDAIEK